MTLADSVRRARSRGPQSAAADHPLLIDRLPTSVVDYSEDAAVALDRRYDLSRHRQVWEWEFFDLATRTRLVNFYMSLAARRRTPDGKSDHYYFVPVGALAPVLQSPHLGLDLYVKAYYLSLDQSKDRSNSGFFGKDSYFELASRLTVVPFLPSGGGVVYGQLALGCRVPRTRSGGARPGVFMAVTLCLGDGWKHDRTKQVVREIELRNFQVTEADGSRETCLKFIRIHATGEHRAEVLRRLARLDAPGPAVRDSLWTSDEAASAARWQVLRSSGGLQEWAQFSRDHPFSLLTGIALRACERAGEGRAAAHEAARVAREGVLDAIRAELATGTPMSFAEFEAGVDAARKQLSPADQDTLATIHCNRRLLYRSFCASDTNLSVEALAFTAVLGRHTGVPLAEQLQRQWERHRLLRDAVVVIADASGSSSRDKPGFNSREMVAEELREVAERRDPTWSPDLEAHMTLRQVAPDTLVTAFRSVFGEYESLKSDLGKDGATWTNELTRLALAINVADVTKMLYEDHRGDLPTAAQFVLSEHNLRVQDGAIDLVRVAMARGESVAPWVISPFVAQLYDWEKGVRARAFLRAVGWRPGNEDEEVGDEVASRDFFMLESQWGRTRRVLLGKVVGPQTAPARAAVLTFISIGREEIIPDLYQALDRHGTVALAETYMNCGESRLKSYAEVWAQRHGYSIQTGKGALDARWGRR